MRFVRQLVLEPLGVSLEPLTSSRKAFWPMMNPHCKSPFSRGVIVIESNLLRFLLLSLKPFLLVEVDSNVMSFCAQVIGSFKGLRHECGR